MRNADKELSQAEIDVETPLTARRPVALADQTGPAQPPHDEDDEGPPFDVE
jgi:hypothetical protein